MENLLQRFEKIIEMYLFKVSQYIEYNQVYFIYALITPQKMHKNNCKLEHNVITLIKKLNVKTSLPRSI